MFSGDPAKRRTPQKRLAGSMLEPSHPGLMDRRPTQRTSAIALHAQQELQNRVLTPILLTPTTAATAAKVAIVAEEATVTAAAATVVEAMGAEVTGVAVVTSNV